ncbi:MAG TPA: ZPR1 zinc finger domain-containing protein [Methanophagales archaeon]|nr:ZPR1 zinc finger domain-containing protein [Methanophagales archaeon]
MKEECPLCGAESELHFVPYEIPFFGEIMITTAVCSSCGYRSTDVMVLSKEKRRRSEMMISSVADLNAIVVRSPFGTIKIPELEVNVEPKRGEAIISTVEGVLSRVEEVVKMLARDVEGAKKKRADVILKQIEKIKSGEASMTLIIDDPTGNSAVIPDKLFFKKDIFTKEIQI